VTPFTDGVETVGEHCTDRGCDKVTVGRMRLC